jgi:hypothetical protein
MPVSLFSDWVNMQVACNKVKRFYADERERNAIERVCGALKDTDVELYKAYALAYGLGLRSSEIQRAKYGDFWETSGKQGHSHMVTQGCGVMGKLTAWDTRTDHAIRHGGMR